MAERLGVYPLGIIGHSHVTVLPLGETLLQRDAKEKVKCSRCTVLRADARSGRILWIFDDNGVDYIRYDTVRTNIK